MRASSPGGPRMRAMASMRMEGNVETANVAAAIEARASALGACVPMIRKTDAVVGSLNVQITLRAPGDVQIELQSPLADDAKRCVLGALDGLAVQGSTGKMMLLLGIDD